MTKLRSKRNRCMRKTRLKPLLRDLNREIEVLEKEYQHFIKGDNRFKYHFGNSHLACHFDAFDAGYRSLRAYIADNNLIEKEIKLNQFYAAQRDGRYRMLIRARRNIIPSY